MRSGPAATTLVEGLAHRLQGLLRQAVDQVDAHRAEAGGARGVDHRARLALGLDAVDGALHLGVEVLDAQADAVEALAPQGMDPLGGDRARIDLDRVFAYLVGRETEVAAQVGHQVVHLGVGKIGRGAAAEMQLLDLVHAGEQRALHGDLALQVGEIGRGLLALPGDDLVAGAVVADRVAERNVQVERERAGAAAGAQAGHGMQVVAVAEFLAEAVGGRIGGIARAVLAEALEQVQVDVDAGSCDGLGCRVGKDGNHGLAHGR